MIRGGVKFIIIRDFVLGTVQTYNRSWFCYYARGIEFLMITDFVLGRGSETSYDKKNMIDIRVQ